MVNQYIASIVQSITEVLPLSSSSHLAMVGISNPIPLHIATGLGGLIYITVTGLLFRFIKQIVIIFFEIIGGITKLFRKRNNFPVMLHIIAVLVISTSIFFYKNRYIKAMPQEIAIIGGILSAVFMYISDWQADNSEVVHFSNFKPIHLLISIIANVISIIPGSSRLGSVYTALRMIGLGRKDAMYIASIQGVILNSTTVLPALTGISRSNLANIYMNTSYIIAGVAYVGLLHALFAMTSRELHYTLLGCCLYRTCIFPFLYMNFA